MKKFYQILIILFLTNGFKIYSQENFYNVDKIQDIRIVFKEKGWKHIMDSVFEATAGEGRYPCDIVINGQTLNNVGIRYKGFSSVVIKDIKNPFNIDLAYTRKNKNYEGFISLRLSNVNYDPSFVREALSYEIARKYMPAPQANFANVYINDTLIGLYSNVEAVNKKFVTKYFPTNDNTFIKGSPAALEYPFGQNANLADTHGADSLNYTPYYELESDYGWADLYHFIYLLNEQPDSVGEVLNIDRALWMHAFNYALLNFDSYIGYSQNYYLYKDDNGKFNTIPWDMNMSFGSFRETDGSYHFNGLKISEMKIANPLDHLHYSVTPRPLMTNLFKNDTYRRMYLAHIRTIIDENFANLSYFQRGQYMQSIIDSAVKQDKNKFYSYEFFQKNLTSNVGASGSKAEIPGIKELIDARVTYLDSFPGIQGAPVISEINHDPLYPVQGSTVWITAKVLSADNVLIGFRAKTVDPFQKQTMFDDGNHHDGQASDGVYGTEIYVKSSSLQYYIYAENDSAGIFSPERAEYEYYSLQPRLKKGDVTINELMVQNRSFADPEGTYSPWIEISNNSGDAISLKGNFLSDDLSSKWEFPDTLIKARSYLIIWANNNTTGNYLQCNFKLSGSKGKVFFSNQAEEIIDSVKYIDQAENRSIGRYPNGWGSFVFMEPSFSACNFIGTTPESGFLIYPNPVRGNLFIEMKNLNNPLNLEIYNTCGQLMKEAKFSYDSENIPVTIKEIDISGFRQGAYYLRVTCRDDVVTKSFIIY